MQKARENWNRIPADYQVADGGVGWGGEKPKYPMVSSSISGEEETNTD